MQSWARGSTTGERSGGEPGETRPAKAVAHQHGVVLLAVDGVHGLLEALAHLRGRAVVEAFGEELDIDLVRRAGHRGAHLAEEDLATDELQAHGFASRFGWESGGVRQDLTPWLG